MFGRRNATAAQNGTFGFKFTHALYHKKRKISRQQLFKFHYDTYTQAGSKAMALAVQRYIKETAKHFRTTRQFVDDIRRKILYTHEYNCEVAKLNLTSKYPKTINFVQLLVKYLELEHELVVKLSPEFPSLESKRQSLVDRLLKTIFQDIVHYSMEKVSTEHLKLLSVVDCLKLLILVRPEYKKETSILDKIATNLLETVGCKELFDKHIKGKHLPFKNESFRKENQSNGLAILGNLTTSDYESDSDSDFDVSKFSDIVQSYAKKKASYVSDGCSTSSDDVIDNCLLKKQIARKPSDTIATVSPPEEDVEEKYVPPTSYNSAIQPIQFRQKEVVTFVLLDSDDDDDNDYIMCISKEVESNSKPKNRLKHTPIQEDCKDGITVQVDDTVQNDDANNVISVPVNASAQIKSQSALPPENVTLPIECVDSYNKRDNLKISEECSSRINDIMVDWSDTEEDSNSFIQNNNDANSVLDELEPNGVVDLNIKQENLMTDTSKNFESIRLEMKDGVNNIDDDDDDVQIIEDIKPAKLDLSDDDDVIEIIDNVKEVAKDNVNTINTTESIIIIDDDIATDCIDNINVTKKEETPVNVASTGPSFAEMNSTNNIICLEETEIQTLDLQIEESKKCIVVPEHVEDDFEQIVKDLERTIKVSESMEKSRESDESIVEEPSQVVDVVPEQIIMEAQEVSEEHLTEETQQPIQETEEFIVHTVKPTQIIVQQIMVQPSEIIVQTPQIIVEPPQIIVQSDQIMELNRFKLDKISEPSSENENHEPLNLTEVSTQSVVSFNNDTTEVTSQPDEKPLEPVEIVSHEELVPLAEQNKSDNATSTKPEVPSDIAMNVTNVANVESTTNVTIAKPVATVLDEPVTTVKVVAIDEEFVPTENKEVIQKDSSAEIIEEPVTEAFQENPVTGEIIKEPVTETNLEKPELTEEICEEPVTVTSKSIQEDPAMEPIHIEPATELLQENSISKATHETDRVIENDEPLNLTKPKVSVFNSIEPDVAPLNPVKNETVEAMVPSDVALPNEILPPETGCAPSKAIYEETEIILSDNLKLLVDVSLNYPMEKMSISKKKLSPRRHKIIEVNNTSEDSNDSEGLLCIDEAINLFDENTVEEEIKFCNSQHEKPVLISIPETPEAEDDFHILQQLESLVEQEDKSSDSSLDNIPLSDVKKLIGNKPVESSVPKFKTKAAVKAYEKLYVKLEKMSLEEVQNKLVRSKSCDIEMGDVKSKRGNSGDRRSSVTNEMLSQEGVEEVKELAKKKRRLGMRVVVRRSVCDEKPEEYTMEKNKSNQPPADIIPQDLSSNLMEHENKTEAVTPSVDAIAEETKPTKPVKAKRGRSKRNRKKPVETINNEKKETSKAKPSILTLTPETKPDECISPTKGGKDLNSLVDKLKKKLEIESTEKSKNGKSKKTKPQNERLPVNGFLVEECKKDVEMMTIKKPRKPGRTGKKKKVDVDVVLNVKTKIEEVAPSRHKILSPGADTDSKKKDVVYLSKKHIIMMNLNKEQEQLRLNNERKKRSAAVDDCDREMKRKRTDSLDVVVMKKKLTNKMIKGDLMVKDDEGNCLVEKSFDTNEVMEYETKGINEECMAKVVEVEPVAMVNVEEPVATLVVEEPVKEVVVDESVANVNEYVAMVNVEEHVTEEVVEKSIITVPEENFFSKVHNKEPVTELIQDDTVAKDVVKKPVSTVNQGVPVTELIQDDTDAKEVVEPVTMVAREEYVTQMHVEEDPVTEIIQNDTVAMEIVVPVETVAVEESFTNVAMKEPVSIQDAEVHVTKVNVEEPVSTVNHQYPVTEIVQNDTVAMEIVVPIETVAVEESFTNVAMKEPVSMKDAEVHVTKVNVEEPVSTVNHQYPVTEIVQNDTVAMEIVAPIETVAVEESFTNVAIQEPLSMKDAEVHVTKVNVKEPVSTVNEEIPVTEVRQDDTATTDRHDEMVAMEEYVTKANVDAPVSIVNQEDPVSEIVQYDTVAMKIVEGPVEIIADEEPFTKDVMEEPLAMEDAEVHVTKVNVEEPASTINQGSPVAEAIQDDTDAEKPVAIVALEEYITKVNVEAHVSTINQGAPVAEVIQDDTDAMEIVDRRAAMVAVEAPLAVVDVESSITTTIEDEHVTEVNVNEPVSIANAVTGEIQETYETTTIYEELVTEMDHEEFVPDVSQEHPVTEVISQDHVTEVIPEAYVTVIPKEPVTKGILDEPVSEEVADEPVTKAISHEPGTEVIQAELITEAIQEEPVTEVIKEDSISTTLIEMPDNHEQITRDSMVNYPENDENVPTERSGSKINIISNIIIPKVPTSMTLRDEKVATYSATDTYRLPLFLQDISPSKLGIKTTNNMRMVSQQSSQSEMPSTSMDDFTEFKPEFSDKVQAGHHNYISKCTYSAIQPIQFRQKEVVTFVLLDSDDDDDHDYIMCISKEVESNSKPKNRLKHTPIQEDCKDGITVQVDDTVQNDDANNVISVPVNASAQIKSQSALPPENVTLPIECVDSYNKRDNLKISEECSSGIVVPEHVVYDFKQIVKDLERTIKVSESMEKSRESDESIVEEPSQVVDVVPEQIIMEAQEVSEQQIMVQPSEIIVQTPQIIVEPPPIIVQSDQIMELNRFKLDKISVTEVISQDHVTEVIPEAYVTVIPKEPVTKGISDEPVSEEVADEPVTKAISHEPGTEVIQAELITEAIQEEPVTEVIKEDSISTTLIEMPDNHEQITRDSMVNYPENDENVPTKRSGSKINIIIPKVPTSMTLRDEKVATYSATDTYQGVITSSETDIETQPESSDLATLQPPDEDSTIIVQEPQTYSDNHDNQTSPSDNPVIEMEFNSDSPEHMLRDMSESTRTSSLDIEDSALNMDSSSTLTSMIDGGNGNNTIENYLVEPYVSFTDNTTIVEVETSSLEDVNLTNKPQPSTVNVADFWDDFPSTVAQSVAPSAVLTDINSFQPCASSADTIKLFNALATSQADPKQCVSPLFLQDISPSKLGIKTTNNMRMVSQQSSQSEMPSTSMDDFTEFKPEFSDKVQAGHHNYISFGGPLLAGSFGDSPEFEDIFDYGTDYAVKNILQRSASEPTSYHVIDPYLDDLIDNSLTTSNKESINSGCLVNSMNSRETQELMDGAILSESSKGSMDSENMDTNINPMTAPDLINESEPIFSKPICWSTDLYKKEEETIKAGASDSPVWNDLDLISEEIISTSETIPQATKENKSPLSSSKVVVLPAAAPLSTPSYHMNQNDLKSFNTLMEEYDITESRFSESSKDANPKRTCPATRSQPSDSFDKLIASDVTFEAAIPKQATPKKAPLETTSRPKTKPSPIGFNGDMEVPAENSKPKEIIALINGIPSRTNSRTRPKPPPRNKGTRSKENSPKYTEALDSKSTEMLMTRSPKTDDLKFKTSVPTIVVEKSLDRVQSINHVNQSDVTNKTGLPTLGFSEQPIIETSSNTRRKQSPRNKSTSSKENSPEGVQSINHVNQSDITKKTEQPTLSFSEKPTTDISSITRQKLPQRNKNTSFKENSPKHETIDSKSPVINVILNKPKDTDDVIVKDDLLVRKSPKEVQPPNHTKNLINSVEVPIEKVKLASSSLPEEAKMEISSTPKLKPSPTNKNTESKENLPKTSDLSQLIKPHENVKNDVPKSPARKVSVEETPARISIGDSVKLRKRKVTNQNLSCHSIDNLLKNDERSQRQKYMEKHSESMKRKLNKEPPIDKKQKRDNVKEQKNIVEDMNVRFDRLKYGTSIEKEDRPKTELTTSSSRHLHNAHSGYQVGSNRPPSYDSRSGHQNRVHSSRPSSSSSMPYANSKSEPHKPLGLHIGSTNQSSWGSGSQSHRFPSSRDQSHHRPGSSSHRRRETEEDKIRINETINNLRRKRENSRLSEKLPPPVSSNANVAKDFLWIRQVSERVDKDNWYTTSDIFPTSVQNPPRKRSNDKRT